MSDADVYVYKRQGGRAVFLCFAEKIPITLHRWHKQPILFGSSFTLKRSQGCAVTTMLWKNLIGFCIFLTNDNQ